MTWKRDNEAPTVVRTIAKWIAPKLGQACAQVGMGIDGTRYAFVFDNPTPRGPQAYWWQALEPTPDDPKPHAYNTPKEWGGLGK